MRMENRGLSKGKHLDERNGEVRSKKDDESIKQSMFNQIIAPDKYLAPILYL
jgi:hypothetical protein